LHPPLIFATARKNSASSGGQTPAHRARVHGT
jgi:hypothetical protein